MVIKGLPYKITTDEIIEFFKDFGKMSESDIFIEESAPGRRTGIGLVVFESAEQMQDAKNALDKAKIGEAQRWVNLFDHNDGQF